MQYRRAFIDGATYFFTVNLADRRGCLLSLHINELRESVREIRRAHPFEIVAWVVLPEHMHAVWALSPGDAEYPMRWNQIKGAFSRRIPKGERVSSSRAAKRERGIWQRRYWEHLIRDENDLIRHVDYIHYNPVKHGHAKAVVDWPFSSFHSHVQRGWISADWGGIGGDVDGDFGEPR